MIPSVILHIDKFDISIEDICKVKKKKFSYIIVLKNAGKFEKTEINLYFPWAGFISEHLISIKQTNYKSQDSWIEPSSNYSQTGAPNWKITHAKKHFHKSQNQVSGQGIWFWLHIKEEAPMGLGKAGLPCIHHSSLTLQQQQVERESVCLEEGGQSDGGTLQWNSVLPGHNGTQHKPVLT